MTALLISTAFFLGIAIGFYAGWRSSRPEIERAELRGLTNRRVMELSRTDAERAAGMVS